MPGLIAAWRAIVRAWERSDTADAIDPAPCSNDNRRRTSMTVRQKAGSRVRGFLELVRHRLRQARVRRNELWLEALQSAYTVRDERRAKRRALSLLMRLLNPEQRQDFRQYRYFHVTGASTGDRYRIRIDLIANIDVLDNGGKVWHRLCVHPAGNVPLYDVMASQLLQLQDPVAEVRLLQQANVFPPLTEVSWYSMPGRHT